MSAIEFRTIATVKILERLKLAKADKMTIPDDALREIARAGQDHARCSVSARPGDQFCRRQNQKEDVEMALGVAGADILSRVIDAIANNKPADAIMVVDDIVMRGHDLRSFCRDLLAHFRDLLLTRVSANEELLESAVCTPEELKRQAALFSESDLVRFFHSLAETETKLRTATQPRYQLEIGIVKLMELRGVESIGEILGRLAALESGQGLTATNKSPSSSGSSERKGNEQTNEFAFVFTATATAPALESTPAASPRDTQTRPTLQEAERRTELAADATPIERIKAGERQKMLLVTVLDSAQSLLLDEGELQSSLRSLVISAIRWQDRKISRSPSRSLSEITGQETGVRIAVKDPAAQNQPLTREDEERRQNKIYGPPPKATQSFKKC
jgi:DNA polymerase-3 subunit gamma/tau